jgi:serine-type D-Ala-D-Ala carboxypeptidase (penicillin-binding protein 5/6)
MDDDRRQCVLTAARLAAIVAIVLGFCFSSNQLFSVDPPQQEKNPAPTTNSIESAAGSQEPIVIAESAAAIDSFSGQFLYLKNENARQYPASSTKILTALLVIEAGNLDKQVAIDLADTKVEPSNLDLKPGEVYTRRQLLFGMMLKSANDVAMALARDNAGSVEAFAEKMTKRAAALGATDSHFKNPHGLHDPDHYTTAHDLALIARAAMEQPFFRQVVSTIYYTWKSPTGTVYQLRNHNRLLRHYAGCNGLKTGFTRAAQQVLVSSALRDGHEVISVVLHTNKPGIWDDSKVLLSYGLIKAGCPPDVAASSGVQKVQEKDEETSEGDQGH